MIRDSLAFRTLALGEILPVIGKLLGQSDIETTARYAHLAEDSVKKSATRVADSIAEDLLANYVGGRMPEADASISSKSQGCHGPPGRSWLHRTPVPPVGADGRGVTLTVTGPLATIGRVERNGVSRAK